MEFARNLHAVSRLYFFAMGFFYLFAVLAFRNQIGAEWAILLMRISDIPFTLVSLIYGGSVLTLELNENEEAVSPWSIAVVAACIILFSLAVFVNFAFPSRI